jgi:hypothetical protein
MYIVGRVVLTHDAELECLEDGGRVPVVGNALVLPAVAAQDGHRHNPLATLLGCYLHLQETRVKVHNNKKHDNF